MQVVLVDSNRAWLDTQTALLARTMPALRVLATPDPLKAAQYGQAHPVDFLFAQLDMKRMNGIQLSTFMRYDNPKIQVFLMATAEQFDDCLEEYGDNVHQLLAPVSAETLLSILKNQR